MRSSPLPLECEKLRPFDVLKFPYAFEGDPDRIPKLFVVARNVVEVQILRCFKPTSETKFYDCEPLRLRGVVEYAAGEACFTKRTLIPTTTYDIPYAFILGCHRKGEFESITSLPDDFRQKMISAAGGNPLWRKKDRDYFSKWFT